MSEAPVTAHPIVTKEWRRQEREVVRVSLDRYNGREMIDARAWRTDARANLRRSRGVLTAWEQEFVVLFRRRYRPTPQPLDVLAQGAPAMKAATIATALGGHPSSGGWHRARCQVHQSGGETLTLMDVPEGVESALAASELLRCPAWAVLSAGGIKQVICTRGAPQ